MSYKRIISIGAHQLDAEILGGPIIIKHNKEAKCTFLHVTSSRLTSPTATEDEKKAYAAKTNQESFDAAKEMGGDCVLMGYTSAELPSVGEFAKMIADYLEKEGADLVISHNRGTLHPRHYYTYEAVTMAVRMLRAKGVNINLLYGECNEDLSGFIPTCYVSMTDEQVDIWFRALKKYTIFNGYVNDNPYYDFYNTMLKVRATEVDSKLLTKAYMHAPLIDNE